MNVLLKNISLFCLFIFAAGVIFSCSDNAPKGKKLAKVYSNVLYEADLPNSTWEAMDTVEMETLKSIYIEHWIRNQLMLQKAKLDKHDKLIVKRMSADYKNLLTLDLFKQGLVREKLDSNVSDDELKDYYEMVKNQFRLDETMVNLKFLRIAADNQTVGRIAQLWNTGDYTEISDLIYLNPEEAILEDDVWLSLERLKKLIPHQMIQDKTTYFDRKAFNDTDFFIKVFDTKHKDDIIPFPLLRDKVEAMIIIKRKNELIDNYIADLYKTETKKNNIKIYE
jgi:hypothetical protein